MSHVTYTSINIIIGIQNVLLSFYMATHNKSLIKSVGETSRHGFVLATFWSVGGPLHVAYTSEK